MNVDVIIVGAGPAGLCLARALSGHGLAIVVVDRQPLAALAEPASDGREIALSRPSQDELLRLGLWQRFPPEDVAPLRDARVFNGPSPFSLDIAARQAGAERLGHLVANRAIRHAAFQAVSECADVQVIAECAAERFHCDAQGVSLDLADGRQVRGRLLVAADSRFSATRRQLGIPARMKDFGKTMLVCRMRHERAHHSVAWEWFGYGQTVALLPLNGNLASVVLTLKPRDMERIRALDAVDFAAEIQRRLEGRLGAMSLEGERHYYPLVGVFAERLVGPRSALVGDAAVGMHPVTAHGFNFGLQSQRRLADQVLAAHAGGRDIGGEALLRRYDRDQRLASWPLYQATNLLVGLYTDDRLPSRLLRNVGLRLAQSLPPLRGAIARHLTQGG